MGSGTKAGGSNGQTLGEIVRPWLPLPRQQQTHENRAAVTATQILGRKRPQEIERAEIEALVERLAKSPSKWTRYARSKALSRLLKKVGLTELAGWVPRIPQPDPRGTTVAGQEFAALIEAANPALRLWIMLCSDCALRSGAARRLTPAQLNRDSGRILVSSKAGRTADVAVTTRVRALIEQCQDAQRPCVQQLAGEAHGRRRSNYDPRQAFFRLRKKLNLMHLRAHDLRRTTALAIYEDTGDLRSSQQVLGHVNLRSTLHYIGSKRLNPVPAATMERVKLAG